MEIAITGSLIKLFLGPRFFLEVRFVVSEVSALMRIVASRLSGSFKSSVASTSKSSDKGVAS